MPRFTRSAVPARAPARALRTSFVAVALLLISPAVTWAASTGGPGPLGLAAAQEVRQVRPAPAVVTASSYAASDLIWSDEFTGPQGARPSIQRWTYNTGNGRHGWGNAELESYTSSAGNAQTDGHGNLAVLAKRTSADSTSQCWYGRCAYTSARIMTLGRFSAQYGRVEARITMPAGVGLWPAFWGLDVNNVQLASDPAYAEMDILEHVGSEPGNVFASLHGRRGVTSMDLCTRYAAAAGTFEGAFHTYAVDWDSARITFSVDGHAYVTRYRSAYGPAWTFDQRMFLVLDLAVGGSWAGPPPASTRFPATMLVDYVRVYAHPSGVVAPRTPQPATRPGGCDTGY